jgi:hypothetical protein
MAAFAKGGAMHWPGEGDEAAGGAGLAGGWLPAGTLESLIELNELSLALMAEQTALRGSAAGALLRQVGELWRVMDACARRRAAACPYLLVDAGFTDPARWGRPGALGVGDAGHPVYASFFSVPGATALARLVFTYAWHLARAQEAAARLLLGMSAPCALAIARLSVREVHVLAESHPQWLKPRWPERLGAWRELLVAASAGEGEPLERARRHGVTLLAAEVRNTPSVRAAPGAH